MLKLLANPYALIGAGLLFLLAVGGAYFQGRSDGRAVVNAQVLRAMKKGLDAIEQQRVRISQAEARASAAEQSRQTEVRSIYVETQRLVERPAMRGACLDADSVRLITRATNAANGIAPGAPADRPAEPAHAAP